MERGRRNTSPRSNSQRLGRCWKRKYNGQLHIEFTQNSHCSSSNPPSSEGMRNGSQKKKKKTSPRFTSQRLRSCWKRKYNGNSALKSHRSYIAVCPIHHHPWPWEKIFPFVPTLNASEGDGNGTTMDSSILNSKLSNFEPSFQYLAKLLPKALGESSAKINSI